MSFRCLAGHLLRRASAVGRCDAVVFGLAAQPPALWQRLCTQRLSQQSFWSASTQTGQRFSSLDAGLWGSGSRSFATGTSSSGPVGQQARKALVNKATASTPRSLVPGPVPQWLRAVSQPGSSIQKAASLQVQAFWQQHRRKLFIPLGVLGVYVLWRSIFKISTVFVNLSGRLAEWGFLAFSAAMVAFGYLYIRRLNTINPDSVYRLAMWRLNSAPGALEALGAPLAGSDVRAMTVTGGGLRLRGWRPSYRSRRLQMIFPIRGAEKRGLVSLEAKKRKGQYHFKLLAVDIGSEHHRLYLEGSREVYDRGGVLAELRDPFLKAVALQEANDAEDELDDAADVAHELQTQRVKDAQAVKHSPQPAADNALYFYERVWLALRRALAATPNKTA